MIESIMLAGRTMSATSIQRAAATDMKVPIVFTETPLP
jgi:hypothetical protein